MGAQIISMRPEQADVEAAWEAYDAAQRRAAGLYLDPGESTVSERMAAAIEAIRLQRRFTDLFLRMDRP